MEEWKTIKGFECYKVSNKGRVKSEDRKVWNYTKKGRILKPHNNGHSYLNVNLSYNGKKKRFYIHRLVAEYFIPNDDETKTEVNHIDFDKTNNSVDNLEWVTQEENKKHYLQSYRYSMARQKHDITLQNKTFEKIRKYKDDIIEKYRSGITINDISNCYGEEVGKDFVSGLLEIFGEKDYDVSK